MLTFSIKQKLFSILVFILYRVILDWSYIVYVSDVYSYLGYVLNVYFSNYIFSWILFLAVVFFTPLKISKASNYFFMSATIFLLAPLTSIYGLTGWELFPVVISIFAIGIIYVLTSIDLKFNIKPVFFKNGKRVSLFISMAFVFLLISWYFISGAVRYFNLDLTKVYDYREGSSALANIGVMAYINNWTYKVFIFYALSWALLKRRFYFFTFLFFIQIFFFGVSAHKSVIFTPLIILSIWWYFRRFSTLLIMPLGFSLVIVCSILSFVFFDDIFTSSIFVRRLLFVPAKLAYGYFDFFSKNDFVYWSNSILSSFNSYKYHLPVGNLIGNYLGTSASANNGFISSGYAHAGLLGVFIYSVIISFLLRVLNYSVKNGVPVWFALALIIIPLRDTMLSSDLFTTLLTHGLIVAFILLFLSMEKKERASCE